MFGVKDSYLESIPYVEELETLDPTGIAQPEPQRTLLPLPPAPPLEDLIGTVEAPLPPVRPLEDLIGTNDSYQYEYEIPYFKTVRPQTPYYAPASEERATSPDASSFGYRTPSPTPETLPPAQPLESLIGTVEAPLPPVRPLEDLIGTNDSYQYEHEIPYSKTVRPQTPYYAPASEGRAPSPDISSLGYRTPSPAPEMPRIRPLEPENVYRPSEEELLAIFGPDGLAAIREPQTHRARARSLPPQARMRSSASFEDLATKPRRGRHIGVKYREMHPTGPAPASLQEAFEWMERQ